MLQCGIQEYVFHILVGGCVKLFHVLYLSIVIFLKKDTECVSTGIFKRNMIARYIDRPNSSFCGDN